MSAPYQIHCDCGTVFCFIRDIMEICPSCLKEYGSHRSRKGEDASDTLRGVQIDERESSLNRGECKL